MSKSDYPTCPGCFGRKTVNGHYCQDCDGLGWTSPAESKAWYEREMADYEADKAYDAMRFAEGW